MGDKGAMGMKRESWTSGICGATQLFGAENRRYLPSVFLHEQKSNEEEGLKFKAYL